MNAPWTPPESPRCAPRPPGLGADHWLLAAETLPTHQKFVLHRVSGEKEFLMRWPYGECEDNLQSSVFTLRVSAALRETHDGFEKRHGAYPPASGRPQSGAGVRPKRPRAPRGVCPPPVYAPAGERVHEIGLSARILAGEAQRLGLEDLPGRGRVLRVQSLTPPMSVPVSKRRRRSAELDSCAVRLLRPFAEERGESAFAKELHGGKRLRGCREREMSAIDRLAD